MTSILWAIVIDFLCGVVDSINGLAFIRELDCEEEYEEISTPVNPAPKTVLSYRREKKGNVQKPPEKVVRHREKVWKRVVKIALINFGIIAILLVAWYPLKKLFGFFTEKEFVLNMPVFLLILPIYLVTRIVMALWFSDVFNACLRRLKLPPAPGLDFRVSIADTICSTILGLIFMLQASLMDFIPIPFISIVSFIHLAMLNSMYSFEYLWASRSVKLKRRIERIQRKWAYFIGFGMLLTILSSLSSNFLINGCIYAILFPFFIISSCRANWDRSGKYQEVPFFFFSGIVTDKISTWLQQLVIP